MRPFGTFFIPMTRSGMGETATPSSTCCFLHNPPYSKIFLNEITINDLLRMCLSDPLLNNNVAVELVVGYLCKVAQLNML